MLYHLIDCRAGRGRSHRRLDSLSAKLVQDREDILIQHFIITYRLVFSIRAVAGLQFFQCHRLRPVGQHPFPSSLRCPANRLTIRLFVDRNLMLLHKMQETVHIDGFAVYQHSVHIKDDRLHQLNNQTAGSSGGRPTNVRYDAPNAPPSVRW